MTEVFRRSCAACTIALLIPLAAVAAAQNVTGTISGTVADEQKQVIPGATVTVINEATNDPRVVTTGPTGDFHATNLPPGTYTVRVEMASFRTAERTRIVLSAAERLSVGTLTLQIGNLGETVTVESSGTQVNPAETQHSGLITSTQIEQIQVRSRDVTSLMRLVPGVRYEDNVEAMGDSFGTLIPHVGGQRRDWNTVMVDGVLGNEIGQANRLAQTINLDAIAEVKILLNTYRAEYGRTGGGQVQIITKSGGSRYAGNLYYYGRNEDLNANNFFNNRAGRPTPRYRFNTYGGNLGGPVPRGEESLLLLLPGSADYRAAGQPAELDDADRARAARGLLAVARQRRTPDFHQGPEIECAVQRHDRRGGLLCQQHHPARADQPERPRAPQPPAAPDALRSQLHQRTVQPSDAGDRRQSAAESDPARRLETHEQRQPVFHLQGLVLGSTWRRRRWRCHGRACCLGMVPGALPEYGSWRERELHEDHPLDAHQRSGVRHPSADRTIPPVERRGLGAGEQGQRRIHARPVPSRAQPARGATEGDLRRVEPAELHVRQPPRGEGRAVAVLVPRRHDVAQGQPLVQGRRVLGTAAQLRRQGRRRRRAVGGPVQLLGRHRESVRHELYVRQRPDRWVP